MIRAAIGDVHGCAEELRILLATVVARIGDDDGEIIMLGDYTDRGPDSLGVLRMLREWSHPRIRMILLRGNHDEMLIRATLYADMHLRSIWLTADSGGDLTVDQLGDELLDYADWLDRETLYSYRTPRHLFAHAGVRPGVAFADQTPGDRMWIREPFLSHTAPYEDGVIVVHGHTPTYGHAGIEPNRLALDTGCVFGGSLTAAIFNPDDQLVGFESVPCLNNAW